MALGEPLSAARDEILARVRRALASGGDSAPVAHSHRRTGSLEPPELIELLADRISTYRAGVHRVTSEDIGTTVDQLCRSRGVRRLGIPPELPQAWRPSNVETIEDAGLSAAELDTLDGVLTGCELAIADTGTLVLAAGPRDGRRALTLVPDFHVCLVEAEQIVELVPEAISRLKPLVRNERRPLTLVSGPSATSDIELDRVEGVHGPRTLEVLIVEPSR